MTSFSVLSDTCQAMLTVSPFPRSRVSAASSVGGANGRASTSIPRIFEVNFLSWRRSRRCPCLIYGSNERSSSRRRAVLASCAAGAQEEVKNLRPFLRARNEEELLSIVRKEAESGRLSSNIADGLEELFFNYRNAVLQSGVPGANEIILSNMAVLFDRILLDEEVPFEFSSHHVAIREPFDYFMFSQNYIRPLIDFRNSYVGNISLFHEVNQKLQQGHNIIFISNHQSEADPAVISLLLERTHPCIGEKMTYVAGDRVIADPLCKPFSMGRNLLCVYSKKHMDDDPKLTESKKKANTRTLKEMALLLRAGSQIIWIAPSGGRDRPDPHTGEWSPAPFDASSVDNMRRLLEYSNVPGHIYPLALLCYEIMPPPPQVEKHIGERRKISFHGVGLSIAPEMKFETVAGCSNPEEAKEAYAQALYESVTEQYDVLKSAIYGYDGVNASNSVVTLSQPWK